jgi:methylmalonyl-CoA/ethylmalonyl-CoA epimerase
MSSTTPRSPRESREPVFTDTMQIGIVVRDLDAAVRRYSEAYGIGPWSFFGFDTSDPSSAKGYTEYGKPAVRRTRAAGTMVGKVMWELIEPLDDDSTYARFLAEKGEGVHHIAVATPDFEKTLAEKADGGRTAILNGEFSGIKVAYLDSQRELGVILEIFNGMP